MAPYRGGRKTIPIDKKLFEELCKIQCTLNEIASVLGVCPDTVESWCWRTYHMGFSDIYKQKRGAGRASLRRYQWNMAEKSVPMAIFLGKQYLGQADNPAQRDEQNNGEMDDLSKALKELGKQLSKGGKSEDDK